MKLQQTQLMLIVDNIRLQKPNKATVYEEVMEVWTKAMKMADKLISGVAQRAQNADELLGLCAWHLYPDIYAIDVKATTIYQKDSLVVKGGLLTIGLQNAGEEGSAGVSWSMPLAHLRFYGKPVMSSSSIGSSSSRVSFHCGIYVVLGILTSEWQNSIVNIAKVMEFVVLFAKTLDAGIRDILYLPETLPTTSYQGVTNLRNLLGKHHTFADTKNKAYWPSMLSHHAQAYLLSSENEQREITRYFSLGRRRYGNAFGKASVHPSPHLGLSETGLYIKLTSPENRISKLREMARLFSIQDHLEGAIIRLIHPKNSIGYQMIEFATLFPQAVEGSSHRTHRRWILFPSATDGILDTSSGPFSEPQTNAIKRSIIIMRDCVEPCGLLSPNTLTAWSHPTSISNRLVLEFQSTFRWTKSDTSLSISYLVHETSWGEQLLPAFQRAQGWQMGQSKHTYADKDYHYLYGDIFSAAVFHSTHGYRRSPFDFALPPDFIRRTLENGELDSVRFVNHFMPLSLPHLMDDHISTYFKCLIAFAHANEIYAHLLQAEIDLNVFTRTLCASHWAEALLRSPDRKLSRTMALTCASLFDTGYLDLQVKDIEDVLAISSGNSIYACEFLLCDPSRRPPDHHLRHVIGNVGKPGLGLLLSPRDTVLREPDLDTWELVNHASFDGRFEDNFASTTLHLSLTGYEQRLNTSRYGCRDKEAYYLEAVVSAYDKGTWVADLDLLHFLQGPFLRLDDTCSHDSTAQVDSSVFPGLTSIDNWYEYLDRPPNAAILRASGNWVARLALAAIPLSGKEALILANKKLCWACLFHTMEARGCGLEERLILC